MKTRFEEQLELVNELVDVRGELLIARAAMEAVLRKAEMALQKVDLVKDDTDRVYQRARRLMELFNSMELGSFAFSCSDLSEGLYAALMEEYQQGPKKGGAE
jgi:hypothetical protein